MTTKGLITDRRFLNRIQTIASKLSEDLVIIIIPPLLFFYPSPWLFLRPPPLTGSDRSI